MLKFVVLLTLAIYQVLAGAVELLPTAQVAPVAPVAQALVTARSSQYFSQNFNALASPVVAPVAPVAQYVAAPVAPVARYIAPTAAAYSQVTRYPSPVAQYIAPLGQYVATSVPYYAPASLVQANVAVAPVAQLVAKAAPLLASPIVASTPLAVASPQPVAVPQPIATQQPAGIPVQGQNTDDEAIEIESARIRTFPQARNQPQRVGESQQSAPVARFQTFPQQNVVGRFQQQVQQQNAENVGYSNGPVAQGRNQQRQSDAESSVRNVGQQQQVVARSGALVAAPGLLRSQQYVQGLYFG